MPSRDYTVFDRLCLGADRVLRTLVPGAATGERASPSAEEPCGNLSDTERQHIAGLMRINHTGEVCAQALYQGQALTARDTAVRRAMEQSAHEEIDHLVWCETRLHELGSHTSVLNPVFYGLSFAIGAGAGLVSDQLSLGFVAATEEQVCKHLEKHLAQIPAADQKSRAILETMLEDEAHHAHKALDAGGTVFPEPIKQAMTAISTVMTEATYRL
ncbi:MAG TPA: 2-polyprenyl-3-methyl-6-methoxy-1,4-benzoquinone monooxygenase [Pseudomonadales bacterium]|jgi:ubiquinone biosynthesis monooxygenase Coq7